MSNALGTLLSLRDRASRLLDHGKHGLLLGMRLYWGWAFVLTGWGKLNNVDRVTEFFASSGVPFPEISVYMAGGVELVGGAMLALGLGGRISGAALFFTMAVAWMTADYHALQAIWSDPNVFVTSTPFLFALASLLVFLLGPGFFSVDNVLLVGARRMLRGGAASSTAVEAPATA